LIYDVIIIGGGASAMMLSSLLDKKLKVCIVEQNRTLGDKVRISGGGKCNITNLYVSSENYLGDSEFVQKVLDRYDNNWLLEYLDANSLKPILKKDNCYFCKNSSSEILDIFHSQMRNIKKVMNTKVDKVIKKDDIFILKTDKDEIRSSNLVIASGSKSYPRIGGSDIGLNVAKHFGHCFSEFEPALVGFTVQPEQFWFKSLTGISLEATATVDGRTFSGAILFTHKGISGPLILNLSLYWKRGKIEFDFLNGATLSKNLNVPKRFLKAYLESIEGNDRLKKLSGLKSYSFSPAGNFGFTKAEASRGGVNTAEIDAFTMQSKLVNGLYFIGEVMDVTGELGGYNLQWAFSSAAVCAEHLN